MSPIIFGAILDGALLKVPVLKGYKYNPQLASPIVRVPLTKEESCECEQMAQADDWLRANEAVNIPEDPNFFY